MTFEENRCNRVYVLGGARPRGSKTDRREADDSIADMPSRMGSALERRELREEFDELSELFVEFTQFQEYRDDVVVILEMIVQVMDDCLEDSREAEHRCCAHSSPVRRRLGHAPRPLPRRRFSVWTDVARCRGQHPSAKACLRHRPFLSHAIRARADQPNTPVGSTVTGTCAIAIGAWADGRPCPPDLPASSRTIEISTSAAEDVPVAPFQLVREQKPTDPREKGEQQHPK
eukprot:scaffold234_cov353-Pavlova_lutheri.AAC.13